MSNKDEQFINGRLTRLPRGKFFVDEKTKQRVWQRVIIHLRNSRAGETSERPSAFVRFGWVNAGLTLLLVVAISGIGGFAAAGSLPGDFLYPVKTEVLERAERVATFNNEEQKIKVLSTQSKRRLAEVNTLVEENRATEEVVTETLDEVTNNNQEVIEITEDQPELIEGAQELADEIAEEGDVVLATLEESEAKGELEAGVKEAVEEGISESAEQLTRLKDDNEGGVEGIATEEDVDSTEEAIEGAATTDEAVISAPASESDENMIESQIQIENVIETDPEKPDDNKPIIISEPRNSF